MDLYAQLRRDEGTKKFPYADSKGKLTIGVGHNLTSDGMSEAVIEFQLQDDVASAVFILNARLPWFRALDSVRQGVLTNMCFNLGFNGLENFPKMLAAFAQGDWQTAASEMKNSAWSKEVGDRATRLEQQILTGEWQ